MQPAFALNRRLSTSWKPSKSDAVNAAAISLDALSHPLRGEDDQPIRQRKHRPPVGEKGHLVGVPRGTHAGRLEVGVLAADW